MLKAELIHFFVKELSGLKYFYRAMLPGLIGYAKRHRFSADYDDVDFEDSAEEALRIIDRAES